MIAADAKRAAGIPAIPASPASGIPLAISPAHSAWDRNECIVARTSLLVRWFTQITLTARVTVKAIPLASSTPMLPTSASGAQASTIRPTTPVRQANTYARRATPGPSMRTSTRRSAAAPSANDKIPSAVYHSTGSPGKPRSMSCLANSQFTIDAALISVVAANMSRISWSPRASATPRRRITREPPQRGPAAGVKLSSAKRAATNTPTRAMPTPEATVAAASPAAQPSAPNAAIPAADPTESQRARAVSTLAIRPG